MLRRSTFCALNRSVAGTPPSFENIRVILEDAGSGWERIVDVTTYPTNLAEDFAAYNEEYARAFADLRPTRTTVGVVALPGSIDVELKVVATID